MARDDLDLSNLLVPETRNRASDGPRIRVLFCFDCKTADELPEFKGPIQHDVLLEATVEKHQTNGYPHRGQLGDVAVSDWSVEEVRRAIIKETLSQGGAKGLDAFDSTFYESRNTFYEDAMKCYSLHLRPQGACPDYKSDRKRVKPNTAQDRKEAGLKPLEDGQGPQVFICDFCPAKAHYQKKFFESKGY